MMNKLIKSVTSVSIAALLSCNVVAFGASAEGIAKKDVATSIVNQNFSNVETIVSNLMNCVNLTWKFDVNETGLKLLYGEEAPFKSISSTVKSNIYTGEGKDEGKVGFSVDWDLNSKNIVTVKGSGDSDKLYLQIPELYSGTAKINTSSSEASENDVSLGDVAQIHIGDTATSFTEVYEIVTSAIDTNDISFNNNVFELHLDTEDFEEIFEGLGVDAKELEEADLSANFDVVANVDKDYNIQKFDVRLTCIADNEVVINSAAVGTPNNFQAAMLSGEDKLVINGQSSGTDTAITATINDDYQIKFVNREVSEEAGKFALTWKTGIEDIDAYNGIVGSYAATDNSLDFRASLLYNKAAIVSTSVSGKLYHATPNFSEPTKYTEYASMEEFSETLDLNTVYMNLYSALGIEY